MKVQSKKTGMLIAWALFSSLLLTGCSDDSQAVAPAPGQVATTTGTGQVATAQLSTSSSNSSILSAANASNTSANTTTGASSTGNTTAVSNTTTGANTTSANGTSAGTNSTQPVSLDSAQINTVQNSGSVALSPNATVSTAVSNFSGGQLTVTAGNGTTPGVTLTAPSNVTIGTLNGDRTGNLTVALNSAATPTAVQTFLQGITFGTDSTASFGQIPISVNLSSAAAENAQPAVRTANITGSSAQTVTVGQNGITTVQQAVDQISATPNAQGSTIVVPAGTANQAVNFNSSSSTTSLAGLGLLGTPGAIPTSTSVGASSTGLTALTINQGSSSFQTVLVGGESGTFAVQNSQFLQTGIPGTTTQLTTTSAASGNNVTILGGTSNGNQTTTTSSEFASGQ